jgi:hypothetical protein
MATQASIVIKLSKKSTATTDSVKSNNSLQIPFTQPHPGAGRGYSLSVRKSSLCIHGQSVDVAQEVANLFGKQR